MEHAKWVEIFPDAIFLSTDSMDLDVDLILTNNLPYRQNLQAIRDGLLSMGAEERENRAC